VVAVEEVVGVEGDETAIGMGDVDASFFDGADVEGMGVEELDDEDAENIFIVEIGGSGDARKTAEEFAKTGGAGLGRVIGGEKFEETIADAEFFFVDDGVAGGVDEDVGLDEAGEWNGFAVELDGVGHGEGVGVTRDGDDIFGAKDVGLLENVAANFAEGEAVGGRIEFFEASGVLDGLQGDAADAGLQQSVVDDLANFAVVETFAQGDDERSGKIVLVELLKGFFANGAEIGAPQIEQGFAFEGIKLQINFGVGSFGGDAFGEVGLLGDFQAVGIDHDVTNRAGLREFEDLKKVGMNRRFAAGNLHDVGMSFVANDGIEHFFDERERAMLQTFRATGGIADGTAEIAGVGDFDERDAGMLLVIGAEAAIVGTTPFHGRVVDNRHFGTLDENLAATAVVVNIVSEKDALGTVIGAALEHEDSVVLENDFAFEFAEAGGANGERDIVKHVGANTLGH
jgi:hypothetical protein